MSGSESQSPRPPTPLWVILLTLLGGAFLLQRGNYPGDNKVAATPPVVVARVGVDASDRDDRMKAPLREFLGLPIAESTDSNQASDSRLSALNERIASHVGMLEFLIVSVADPIDAATNYRFDLQIDTLHKALGADGYVPDHFYLPWGPPEKDKPSVHRTEPGVLLYRRNGRSKADENPDQRYDLLLVYLVGETPTSGIHKQAFLAAVRQINKLGAVAPSKEGNSLTTISVAGPVFTGGADSLALAIRQACDETNKGDQSQIYFQVITGTAVSIDRERFKDLAGKENADLHSTLLPGKVLRDALIDHVDQRNRKRVRIAWLTETATGYGFSTREQAPDSQRNAEIIEFHFPINISRSGYAKSRRSDRANQIDLGPETSRLPIPFDDPGTARDVPPMQTPQITAATAELILGQILTRIRSEAIKYVGISSSDPRDPIFLAELIQEQCPNVQIMLVGSDVLHLHSEYRSIMHGTLVSSTYPLHPEALDLCFPFGESGDGNSRSIVLSNDVNYGLYNAVLILRGLERKDYQFDPPAGNVSKDDGPSHNRLKLHYSQKADSPSGLPVGYSMPFESVTGKVQGLRPHVWISRIGSTGIFPITVGATDKKTHDKSGYTLKLNIELPADETMLSARHIRSQIPASLNIASLIWLVFAAIYCVALLKPESIGKWAKPLVLVPDHPQKFQPLHCIFRAFITAALVSVLMLFVALLTTYHRRVGSDLGDHLPWVHYKLSFSVAIVLILCLLADWWSAFRGWRRDPIVEVKRLIADWRASRFRLAWPSRVSDALMRLIRYLWNGPAPEGAETPPPTAESNLSWHLIAARAIGLTIILALVCVYSLVARLQLADWRSRGLEENRSHPDVYLWFMRNSDMWNSLSPAMTAQLQAIVLIILAYGMLLQMHLLGPEFTIIRPDPSTSAPLGDEERRKRIEAVQHDLLLPLLSRWRRDQPVLLYILGVAAALLWMLYLGTHVQSVDHYSYPISFPTVLLLVAGGFWCVRMSKLFLILRGLDQQLEDLTTKLRERWPAEWSKIFDLLPEKPVGLHELIWTSRPLEKDRESAQRELQEYYPSEAARQKAERKLCAIEIHLFIRQYFHHIVRLGRGLAIAACLLFISAHTYPYSQEPLVRLSASVMLAAIGCVIAWYYLKFDRNELLSHLVGTDPKRVSINWSMIQTVAPALLLTAIALLSQTFPGIWQWMRNVLEPMASSSL